MSNQDVALEPIKFKELKNINGQLHVGGYDGEEVKPIPVIGGWESFNGTYWFATEIDSVHWDTALGIFQFPKKWPKRYYGLVQGDFEEFGTWFEHELEELISRFMAWKIKDQDLPYAGRRSKKNNSVPYEEGDMF